jgi:hypothetical protein
VRLWKPAGGIEAYPLKHELWPDENELKLSAKDLRWFEAARSELHDPFPLTAENPYRKELVSFITELSESEEVIRDAVQD